MPNHVTNILRFDCGRERMEEILDAISGEGGERGSMDFHRLCPMPERLRIEAGSNTYSAIEVYLTWLNPECPYFGTEKLTKEAFADLLEKVNGINAFSRHRGNMPDDYLREELLHRSQEEMLELGKTAVDNILDYGAATWYDWCTDSEHWNTKWNAYDCEPYADDNRVRFSTAWSAPHPVIRKLSERFPDVPISHSWADEDLGTNCGRIRYKGGEITEQYAPVTPAEAMRFSERLWEDEPENGEDYGVKYDISEKIRK